MAIYHDDQALTEGGILTMGTFDGVHRGHQALLAACQRWAQAHNSFAEVWVFHPHPRQVLRGEKVPALTDLEERVALLKSLGIAVIRIVRFTTELSQLSAAEFFERWIQRVSAPRGAVLGYDHRFGRQREGDANLLRASGLAVQEVEALLHEGRPVSSSWIRALLREGEVEEARALLGYPFTLRGIVKSGRGEARTFGVPTANLPYPSEKIRLAAGIYTGWAVIDPVSPLPVNQGLPALIYLPPIGDLEVHFLRGSQNSLYGKRLAVGVLTRLRFHKEFDSQEALIAQIHADVKAAMRFFGLKE